jgi:hypothetical protein
MRLMEVFTGMSRHKLAHDSKVACLCVDIICIHKLHSQTYRCAVAQYYAYCVQMNVRPTLLTQMFAPQGLDASLKMRQ